MDTAKEETKPELSPEVRKHYSEMARKNGNKLFAERGSEYFSRIAKMRKPKKKEETPTVV